jgi:hypothetical protein
VEVVPVEVKLELPEEALRLEVAPIEGKFKLPVEVAPVKVVLELPDKALPVDVAPGEAKLELPEEQQPEQAPPLVVKPVEKLGLWPLEQEQSRAILKPRIWQLAIWPQAIVAVLAMLGIMRLDGLCGLPLLKHLKQGECLIPWSLLLPHH